MSGQERAALFLFALAVATPMLTVVALAAFRRRDGR